MQRLQLAQGVKVEADPVQYWCNLLDFSVHRQ